MPTRGEEYKNKWIDKTNIKLCILMSDDIIGMKMIMIWNYHKNWYVYLFNNNSQDEFYFHSNEISFGNPMLQ